MRVMGYVRVSTDEQASSGVSLAAQAEKIQAYCSLYELELLGIIEDPGASAKTIDRPGLQRVLAGPMAAGSGSMAAGSGSMLSMHSGSAAGSPPPTPG